MAFTHEQSRLEERAVFEREWSAAKRAEAQAARVGTAAESGANSPVSWLIRFKRISRRLLDGAEASTRSASNADSPRDLQATFVDPIMKSARDAFALLGSMTGTSVEQTSRENRSTSSLPEWTMHTIYAPIPAMPGMTPSRAARPDAPTSTWPAHAPSELASSDEETRLMRVPATGGPERDRDR